MVEGESGMLAIPAIRADQARSAINRSTNASPPMTEALSITILIRVSAFAALRLLCGVSAARAPSRD
jgi:hypothetical protein